MNQKRFAKLLMIYTYLGVENMKRKVLSLAINSVLATTMGLSVMPLAVQAQDDAADTVDEIVVTGSRIRRVDLEGPSPVVVVSAEDIKEIGFSTVQDVLSDLPQNSGGSFDQQQAFSFTPAASGIDLRGVGVGRSLTLINGKRTPKYPIASGGTDNFSDTANIPLGAVERVEVLTSGASAIYGSDAMGGVVNIILKEDYDGFEISGKLSDTDDGGRATQRTSLLAGANTDTGNIMFFLEYEEREQLNAGQRNNYKNLGTDLAFNHPFGSYSTYGISLRDSSNNVVSTLDDATCLDRGLQPRTVGGSPVCGFNRSARRDIYPEIERTSGLVSYNFDLANDVSLFGRVSLTHGETDTNIEPMPVDDYTYFVGSSLDANGDPTVADPGFVTILSSRSGSTARFAQAAAFGGDFATLADGTYYYARRMLEFGNRTDHSEVDNLNFVTGLEGSFKDWDWTIDGQFARVTFENQNGGYASADSYFGYLTSGTSGRSPFDLMTPAEVEAASYTPFTDAESTFTGFSANVTGDLFELPAGSVAAAFGAESYREWFYNQSDTESLKGNILATGGSSGKGSRDYYALYSEFLIPVIEDLDVTLAVRYDDYSDFGTNTSPQVSIEYKPTEKLMLRALWADTFRAPDMQRVYGDPTAAFSQVVDPFGCAQQGGTIDPNSPIQACAGEAFVDVFVGANPNLDAETGTNWNVGLVWNAGDYDFTLDVWGIEIDNIVNDLSAQQIVTDYAIYEDLITRNAVTGVAESVNAVAQNLSFRETSGVDFTASYRLLTDNFGGYRFKLKGSYLSKYEEQFSVTDPVEDIIETDRVPEWRAQLTFGWDYAEFSTNLYFNYTGSMNGTNVEEGLGVKSQIEDQWRINLSTAYETEKVALQFGINNVANAAPEVDYTDFGWPFYPQEYYNAVGREYYVSATYRFGK